VAVVKKLKGAGTVGKKKVKEVDDTPAFKISKALSVPVDNLAGYIILLFGEKKIGKTTLAAQMGKNYIARFEEGTKALRVYGDTIGSWRDAKSMAKQMLKDTFYDTVTVDTIEKMHAMCDRWVCQKLAIGHLSEADWGQGYQMVRQEIAEFIDTLAKSGKGVVLISHADVREITARDGNKYDRLTASAPKISAEVCEALVDVWAYYGYEGRRRVLQILGDDHVAAGHRLDGRFRTPDGRPLRLIDMGKTPQQGYKNLLAAFANEFTPVRETDADDDSVPSVAKKAKKKTLRRRA
jgi:hypothetical protein